MDKRISPIVRQCLSLLLIYSVSCYASRVQGNSWNQVRYNGGTFQTKVDPHDWNNQLTVTSDLITFKLKDGQTVEIPTKSVTGLSYGQEAHRRIGTMIALGILVTPLALFGLFHKTRLHFIGIEYTTGEHKHAGLLLQGHKDNYRAILMALKSATGAPLAVSAADRQYVPTGIQATVVDENTEGKGQPQAPSESKPAASPAAAGTPAPQAPFTTVSEPVKTVTPARLLLVSSPDGAEIEMDGRFVGNTPSTIEVSSGDHAVTLRKSGYRSWTRKIKVTGGDVKINAELEKNNPSVINLR